ncbi:xanthine/Uracil/Vitamin C permease [Arthrobacter sp. Hiyo6]|nr:xanthine/Uracil/Vitamin C permease [Arthrobacter sp. Hiyo6]
MAYIVILNPLILGGFSPDNAPVDVAGGWLSAAQVGAVTGLTAGVMTILFGIIANLPFGLAAGWASTPSSPWPSSTKSPGPRPWGWWSSTAF